MTTLIPEHVAALRLAITTRQLAKMVEAGAIPHVILPDGSIRFSESDLEEMVNSRRQNSVMLRGVPDSTTLITS